jgi:23S rRNA (uracil1939-C5)-methyltransferase
MRQKQINEAIFLEGIHSSGRSMGKFGNKNVYLEGGIPGEQVEFMLEGRKRGFYGGRVTSIIHNSPHRVTPFCKHYGQCGGCPWQHIEYNHQLDLKRQILVNALNKYDIPTPEIPAVIPSPLITGFRHRMEYTFSARDGTLDSGTQSGISEPGLGFHLSSEPNKIVDIEECFLQPDWMKQVRNSIKAHGIFLGLEFYDHYTKSGFLRSLTTRVTLSGELMIIVGFTDDRPAEREKLLSYIAETFPSLGSLCWTIHLSSEHSQMQGEILPHTNFLPYLFEHLAGYTFRFHAGSFFQPNPYQAEQIYTLAREWASLSGRELVYDLYTGVGTLALFLAPQARQVIGIEGTKSAIDDANENALMNGIRNAVFLAGDILDTFKPPFLEEHGRPDLIVLDPPRSGTLIEIKKTINTSGAQKVIYLSCNPVSLAFDLKQLTEVYRITCIQPFDMLPQTQHLETLVMLEIK